jgi:hypothetical protein
MVQRRHKWIEQKKRSARTNAGKRHRALRQAVQAWRVGRPHRAWQILAEAGMADHWQEFQRVALRRARERFLARMTV